MINTDNDGCRATSIPLPARATCIPHPSSSIVNNWKGPRLAFDWGYQGKGCITHTGIRVATVMDLLPLITEPTLVITESSFCSYDETRAEREEFIQALYRMGCVIGTIPTKQTKKYRTGEKTDHADAKAIYEASFHQHLIIPARRNYLQKRDNKFDVIKRYIGDKHLLSKFPAYKTLDDDSKIVFGDGKKYSLPFIRDFYDAACCGDVPKNREMFEHKIGFYAHGYPCYFRSVFQQRARHKTGKLKGQLRLPWTRMRASIRRMFKQLKGKSYPV